MPRTRTEIEVELAEQYPHWTRSKVKRTAERRWREEYVPTNPSPFHILGLHDLHDPTPADAIRNITRNDLAAARRLGLA